MRALKLQAPQIVKKSSLHVKKASTILLCAFIASSIFIDCNIQIYGEGVDTTIDSYSESNQNTALNIGGQGNYPAVGQAFKTPNTISYNVTEAIFSILRFGTSAGGLQAKLYPISGTYGSNAAPSGAALAISDLVNASTISNSTSELVHFAFSGANQITLSPNTAYAITVENTTGDWTGSNTVQVGYDSTSPTHSGNYFYNTGGGWLAYSTRDTIFYVYGTQADTSAPTFGAITANTTVASAAFQLTCTVSDDTAVSGYIVSTNNTGPWVNSTWTSGSTATLTGSWNNTGGNVVSAKVYANDTSNNWAASSQQDFTLTGWNLHVKTATAGGSSLLQNTTVGVNGTINSVQETSDGWANWTGIPDGPVTLNATWLFPDLVVNTTSLTVSADTELNLTCSVYPYTLDGATWHIGTDRDVLSASGSSLSFDNSTTTTNILAFTAPSAPTYILGLPYSLDTDWNGTSGVFRKTLQNTTYSCQLHFDSLGGRYIERSDAALSGLSWNGYKLTLQLDSAGGALKVFCGANAPTVTGLSGSYNKDTGMLTGTPTSTTVLLDWTESHEIPAAQHPLYDFKVQQADLGKFQQGQNRTVQVTFSFSSSRFTVTSLTFGTGTAAQWLKPATEFPANHYRGIEVAATGTIDAQLAIPDNAKLGNYTVVAQVSGATAEGIHFSDTATLTFQVEKKPSGFDKLPENLMNPWLIAGLVAAAVIVAAALLTRRRH